MDNITTTLSPWYLDPEYLTLLIAVVAIIASAWGVIHQIQQTRIITKRQRTLDFLLDAEQNNLHEAGLKILRKYNDKSKSTARLGEKDIDDKTRSDADKVFELLNYYEYLAVAVKQDILCEETLLKANLSTFIEIFESSNGLITEIRKESKTVYVEIEWMYKRWKECGYYGKLPTVSKNSA